MPICLELGAEEVRRGRSRNRNEEHLDKANKEEVKEIMCWDKESRTLYREKTKKLGWEIIQENETVDKTWERLKGVIKDAIHTWKKRKVKRIYVRWKTGKGTKERYVEERKSFRIFLEEKRKKKREEEEKELRNIHWPSQVWKFINKKRNKREWKENNIEKEEWRRYFMNLLEGADYEGEQGHNPRDKNKTLRLTVQQKEKKRMKTK